MSLTFTPRQLAQRSDLYHQLSQLSSAGVGLSQALEIQRRSPPAPSFRLPLSRMIDGLAQGGTFTEALSRTGRWLPPFDLALLQSGETSGRLPACLELLAGYYRDRSRLASQVLSNLAYPFFLFHFAVLIGPFPDLFRTGSLLHYFGQTFGILLPLYALIIFGIYALQGRRGERWRSLLETVLHPVPFLGSARRSLALARLSAALESLISAGVNIVEAWNLAAAASGSSALQRRVLSWQPRLAMGQTPGEVLAQSPEFPELFANLYQTAEITGQLDETLARLRAFYQEEGAGKLRLVAEWTPRLFYFAIVLMIAYRVVSFYAGYYGQLNDVLREM